MRLNTSARNCSRIRSVNGKSFSREMLNVAMVGLGFTLVEDVFYFVAIFGGSVMTLAWGLLFKLMPPDDRGAISGLATTTKGIGLIFGTLLAGILIDVLAPSLPETEGYQVLWPVLAIPILLAIPLVFSLIKAEEFTGGS